MAKAAFQIIAIFLLVMLLNSCAFFKLKEEIKIMETNIGIGGEIKNRSQEQKPLIVLLYTQADGKQQIVGFKILEKTDDFYFFLVPIGDYYILAFEDGNDYIKLFVSISTPWGGLETAQKGVESAPAVIPSWHDVVPNSPFIQGIFSKTLKPQIDYYLIFSYKGDCSLFMDNNDGSVTLRAQLDLRAQKDALSKWGFDQGHVSILSSPDVLRTYAEILEETGSRSQPGLRLFGIKN